MIVYVVGIAVAVFVIGFVALMLFGAISDHASSVFGALVGGGLGALVGGALSDTTEGMIVGAVAGLLLAIIFSVMGARRERRRDTSYRPNPNAKPERDDPSEYHKLFS